MQHFIKGIVFLDFPEKVHILHIFGENRLIEWKAVFFLFQRQKKKIQILDRMNEWHFELLQEKKNTKKKYSFERKKNGPRPTFTEEKKNNTVCIFFFRILEKKKYTILGFDWLNGQRTFSGKKKYGTFVEA